MASRLLGRLPLDDAGMSQDIIALSRMPHPPGLYDEFTSGRWVNLPLVNSSGDGADGLFQVGLHARPTELLRQVPHIQDLLTRHFARERLFMVRARDVTDWFILPHRDYLELDHPAEALYRVLIVLEHNPYTMNSDEDVVFRMRKGEVWHLDAAQAHSGINSSSNSRWSLCLDFLAGTDFHPRDIFADPERYDPTLEADIVSRKPVSELEQEQRIQALSGIVNRHNIRDMAFMLGKAHLTEALPTTGVWYWLKNITRESGDRQLIDLADRAFEFFIGSRKMHESFTFAI
jgi:hypothetical protein